MSGEGGSGKDSLRKMIQQYGGQSRRTKKRRPTATAASGGGGGGGGGGGATEEQLVASPRSGYDSGSALRGDAPSQQRKAVSAPHTPRAQGGSPPHATSPGLDRKPLKRRRSGDWSSFRVEEKLTEPTVQSYHSLQSFLSNSTTEDRSSNGVELPPGITLDVDERIYQDGLVFDHAKHLLVNPRQGRYVLLLSMVLQCVLLALLFLAFHHRSPDFGCCNMWVVIVALCILMMQYFYLVDWNSIQGYNPVWHRSNLFVPIGFALLIFLEWILGMMSLLAHAMKLSIFGFSDLLRLERYQLGALSIMTFILLVTIPLLCAIAYAHRNNLGEYYYVTNEEPLEITQLSDNTTPVLGSFDFRGILRHLCVWLGVDTSRRAKKRLPILILLSSLLQVPFYCFVALAQSFGQSVVPILFLCIGIINLMTQWEYTASVFTRRSKRMRKWNRVNLFTPLATLCVMIAAWLVAMVEVFFISDGGAAWEDILPYLDATEKVYFAFSVFLFCVILVIQIYLANLHRKGWCDGKEDLEIMNKVLQLADYSEYPKRSKTQKSKRGRSSEREHAQELQRQLSGVVKVEEVDTSLNPFRTGSLHAAAGLGPPPRAPPLGALPQQVVKAKPPASQHKVDDAESDSGSDSFTSSESDTDQPTQPSSQGVH